LALLEDYLDAVRSYYDSAERPYRLVGVPNMQRASLSPTRLAERGARTIVLGAPGSGKTTLLDAVALDTARSGSGIPVFVSLRNYSSSLGDLLQVSLDKFVPGVSYSELVDQATAQRPLTLLFDGMDECAPVFAKMAEREIEQESRRSANSAVVVTSRTLSATGRFPDWMHVEIPSLTMAEVAEYLSEFAHGDELMGELARDDRIMSLAQRPAFLHTIAHAWLHQANVRDYLMREIPMYTAWRGHTKSNLSSGISTARVDGAMAGLALNLAATGATSASRDTVRAVCSNVGVGDDDIDALADALVASYVVGIDSCGRYGFTHLMLLEAYAARAIVERFRHGKSLDYYAYRVFAGRYSEGIAAQLVNLLEVDELQDMLGTLNASAFEALADASPEMLANRLTRRAPDQTSVVEGFLQAAVDAEDFAESQSSHRKDVLVFALHGFNTRGEWKNRLGLLLTKATDGRRFLYFPWDYGVFRFKILSPFSRRHRVDRFQKVYNDVLAACENPRPEVCAVAHSFGTYIVAHALRRFPEVAFDRVLFVGAALPRRFEWQPVLHRVGRLLNLVCGSDSALVAACLVPGLGDAGRSGFVVEHAHILQRRERFSDHGDLFGDEYMRQVWVPFLRDGEAEAESATA
jgi:hypothetical protein